MKKADFAAVSKKFNISPITARILRNRDLVTDDEIGEFLNGDIGNLNDPMLMKDMDRAVDIISGKIAENRRIRIIGDYDIDGVNSVYILMKGLAECGAEVDYDIPDRLKDGYGINASLIDRAIADGIDIIITCDNGITAFDAVKYGKDKGLTVIVTDHHSLAYEDKETENNRCASGTDCENPKEKIDINDRRFDGTNPDETTGNRIKLESEDVGNSDGRIYFLPVADAVVNPHRPDCKYPYKDLCGASVAWKFVGALYRKFGISDDEWIEYIENAAFATVGDVVDLTGENRIIVREGLKRLNHTKNIGLRALRTLCGIQGELGVYHLGFVIGPCINAGGRLDTAKKAIELLLSENQERAYELAAVLKELNDSRKNMTSAGVEAAERIIEEHSSCGEPDKVIVIYLPDCHESLAGIIAGRLKEKYYRPVFVLTDAEAPVQAGIYDDVEAPSRAEGDNEAEALSPAGVNSRQVTEYLKGSGRSIEGYSMFEELSRHSELLEKFGGHPMAAGLTIKKENLEPLRRALNDSIELSEEDMVPKIELDMELPFYYATEKLADELGVLEPIGKGNRQPLFALRNVEILDVRIMGKNRNVIKMNLKDSNGHVIEGIRFASVEGEAFVRGMHMNIAYSLKTNEFRGIITVQAQIKNYKII